MQSSVIHYWLEIFRGIPYLLQRSVDSLSHTAQWAVSVDLLPCCKKSYSCRVAYFRSGLFAAQYRICIHTLDCHISAAKKQQTRRSSAHGKLESEKVGLPWAWPGVLEGTYDPCFDQIHARNIIKRSETQITEVFIVSFIQYCKQWISQLSSITSLIFMAG